MLCFIEGLNCSSFGTKHGAAPLGPKHYRTELETLVYLFQTASLSLFLTLVVCLFHFIFGFDF